jgi:hypothetical protein
MLYPVCPHSQGSVQAEIFQAKLTFVIYISNAIMAIYVFQDSAYLGKRAAFCLGQRHRHAVQILEEKPVVHFAATFPQYNQ